jgi:putative toxin-antitoxin system antitoxin component (TIGR02293 family)
MATAFVRFDADNLKAKEAAHPWKRTWEILGLPKRNVSETYTLDLWEKTIHKGFSTTSFDRVGKVISVTPHDLASIIVVSTRTVDRWKEQKKRMSPEASDRLFRIARIVAHAESVFGKEENAHDWLREPNVALNGKRPLDMLDTDIGASTVDDTLTRIEYGIY